MDYPEIKNESNFSIVVINSTFTQDDYLRLRALVKKEVLEKGIKNIVFDCDSVTTLPSVAFGVFCSISRDSKRSGGNFVLLHVGCKIQEVMEITHTNKIIPIMNSLSETKQFMKKACSV